MPQSQSALLSGPLRKTSAASWISTVLIKILTLRTWVTHFHLSFWGGSKKLEPEEGFNRPPQMWCVEPSG